MACARARKNPIREKHLVDGAVDLIASGRAARGWAAGGGREGFCLSIFRAEAVSAPARICIKRYPYPYTYWALTATAHTGAATLLEAIVGGGGRRRNMSCVSPQDQ
eukprot:scaffold1059_cov119-Isochrysis_galbana.AAC.7